MKTCLNCGKKYKIIGEIEGFCNGIEAPTCDCESKRIAKRERREFLVKEVGAKILDIGTPERFKGARLGNLNCQHLPAVRSYAIGYNKKLSTSLMFAGNVGTGKTSLALALARELVLTRDVAAKFYNCADMFNEMEATYKKGNGSIHSFINGLLKYDFIIFDDFAKEKYTEKRIEWAFLIFDKLYSAKKTFCITLNSEAVAKLEAVPDFHALIDRFIQVCVKYSFTGASLRRPPQLPRQAF